MRKQRQKKIKEEIEKKITEKIKENIKEAFLPGKNRLVYWINYYCSGFSPFIGLPEEKEIRQLCYDVCKETLQRFIEETIGKMYRNVVLSDKYPDLAKESKIKFEARQEIEEKMKQWLKRESMTKPTKINNRMHGNRKSRQFNTRNQES